MEYRCQKGKGILCRTNNVSIKNLYMKTTLLTLLILFTLTNTVIAQTRTERKTQELFWNNDNKDAFVTEVPEKWKNESAVILYKEEYSGYENYAKSIINQNRVHLRIKLQDKNAIEKYAQYDYEVSTYYLGPKNYTELTIVGIKVIKTDGKEIIIDVKEERVKSDANDEIRYKVAIPGLEIGDILDIYNSSPIYGGAPDGKLLFPKIERTIAEDYPVIKKKLSVEVENDFFLRMESFNGAPAIKEVPTDKRVTKKFELEATDVEKQPAARWSFPLAHQPSVKLQVVFALRRSDENSINFFLPEVEKERGSFATDEEMLNFIKQFSSAATSGKDYVELRQKVLEKTLKNDTDILNEIINFLRFYKYTAWTEPVIAFRADVYSGGEPCEGYNYITNQDKFIFELTTLLKEYNIL
jgi:hypothetical protein